MKRILLPAGLVVIGAVLLSAGCSRDVDAVAVDAKPAPEVVVDAKPAPVAAPAFRDVTIPAGTRLLVRLESEVNSRTSRVEDRVNATLSTPVTIGETLVLPEGSQVRGDVITAEPAGKVKGRAQVALRFRTLTVGRQSYPIVALLSRLAPATKRQDAEKIALPAVGGAIVGAIVGGKKGAAIGAAAGGGTGAAVVLATSGKEASIPGGSVVALRLQKPVTVRVKT
jgi:hypothetical protein